MSLLKKHIKSDQEVTILLPEKYKHDSDFIEKRFSVNFERKQYLFSDSMYYTLHKGHESVVYLFEGGRIVRSAKLKDINASFFVFEDTALCLQTLNSDHWLKQYGEHIFISQSRPLGRITFYDSYSGYYKEFSIDTNWTEYMYRSYYGEEAYKEYLTFLKTTIDNQTHSVQSEILYAIPADNERSLYFLASSFFFNEVGDKKVRGKKEYFIIEVDIHSMDILNTYYVDQALLPGDYIINEFFFSKSKASYYFQVINANSNHRNNLAIFHLVDDKIQFKSFAPSTRSHNYFDYEIFNNFLNPVVTDELYAEIFAHAFYDIQREKLVKIPVEQIEFESLNQIKDFIFNLNASNTAMPITYSIIDLKSNRENYEVLYKSFLGNYHVLVIDKTTHQETDHITLTFNGAHTFQFPPYFDASKDRTVKVLYKDEKCFTLYEY